MEDEENGMYQEISFLFFLSSWYTEIIVFRL